MMPNTTASSAAAKGLAVGVLLLPEQEHPARRPAMIAASRNSHADGMWK
jgi:hypothetical protein